jgi:hypothetical protein
VVVASEACDDGGLEARKYLMISYKLEIIAEQINMFYIYLTIASNPPIAPAIHVS